MIDSDIVGIIHTNVTLLDIYSTVYCEHSVTLSVKLRCRWIFSTCHLIDCCRG